jgi:hypothetical protein
MEIYKFIFSQSRKGAKNNLTSKAISWRAKRVIKTLRLGALASENLFRIY